MHAEGRDVSCEAGGKCLIQTSFQKFRRGNLPIATRKAAKAVGAKMYDSGKPCINGHISERLAKSGRCVRCAIEADQRFYSRFKAVTK
jgi:hypothetical protein